MTARRLGIHREISSTYDSHSKVLRLSWPPKPNLNDHDLLVRFCGLTGYHVLIERADGIISGLTFQGVPIGSAGRLDQQILRLITAWFDRQPHVLAPV